MKNKFIKVITLCLCAALAITAKAEQLSKQEKIDKISAHSQGTLGSAKIVDRHLLDNAKLTIKNSLQKEINALDNDIKRSKITADYIAAVEKSYDAYFNTVSKVKEEILTSIRSEIRKLYNETMTDEDLDVILNYLDSNAAKKSAQLTKEILPKIVKDIQNRRMNEIIKASQTLKKGKAVLSAEFHRDIDALKKKNQAVDRKKYNEI